MQIEYLAQSLRLTSLTVGESAYIAHENCTTRNKMWVMRKSEGYSMYCNKCGYKRFIPTQHRPSLAETHKKVVEVKTEIKLPDDYMPIAMGIVNRIPDVVRGWLYKHHVNLLAQDWSGIGWSEKLQRLILPVYNFENKLVIWQGRSFSPYQAKYYTEKLPDAVALFRWSSLGEEPNEEWIVLTEDIISAVRIAYDTAFPAIALLGTNPHLKPLIPKILGKKLLLWLDPDHAGLSATLKLKRELEFFAKKVIVNFEATCEPKELSPQDLTAELMRLTENE